MKTLILTFLVLISSCNQQKQSETTEQIDKEEIAELPTESNFTILHFNSDSNWKFKNAEPTELTLAEIDKIEPILKMAILENNKIQEEYLKKHNAEHPKNQRTETGFELDLDEKYYRQYFPVINDKGEKEIWINFFCSTMNDNWKTDLVIVSDGGNCYFNIKINLTKNTSSDLRINGNA